MAATTPTIEPREIRSGDSIAWTKSLSDYSYNDGWRLTYYIRGPRSLTVGATQNGTSNVFAVAITAEQTAALEAGSYWMEGKVALLTDVKTVYRGNLAILPNFSDLQDGWDGRTHARRMLDAINSAQIDAVGNFIVSYSIDGQRSVTLYAPEQINTQRDYWAAIVAQEERQEAINRGQTGAGKIYMRFTCPQ